MNTSLPQRVLFLLIIICLFPIFTQLIEKTSVSSLRGPFDLRTKRVCVCVYFPYTYNRCMYINRDRHHHRHIISCFWLCVYIHRELNLDDILNIDSSILKHYLHTFLFHFSILLMLDDCALFLCVYAFKSRYVKVCVCDVMYIMYECLPCSCSACKSRNGKATSIRAASVCVYVVWILVVLYILLKQCNVNWFTIDVWFSCSS